GRTIQAYGYRGQFDYSGALHLDVRRQEVRNLLQMAPDLYPGQTGLGQIVGTTDNGRKVLMPAFHSDKPTLEDPRYGVYAVLLDNHRARLVKKGSQSTIDWFVDAAGDMLARVDFQNHNNQYRIWSLRGERSIVYERTTGIPPIGPLGVMSTEHALVFGARPRDADVVSLYRLGLDDGELTGPIMGRDDAGVEVVQTDLNRVVYGVQYSGFLPTYEFFDESLNQRIERIQDELQGTSVTLVSWSDGFRDLVVQTSGGWNSGYYLLFAEGAKEPEILAAIRPEIAADQVVPTEIISYAARDGLDIPALLTVRPEAVQKGNSPLIVIPHGGPESYDRFEFDWLAQYFASRGYVVLQPQFRGSSGFGSAFARAGRGEWGGKMQSDIDDGVEFLVDSGLVDPEQICIVGASYGGYAALAAGAFSPGLYRCVVSIAGVADLERMLKSDRRIYGRDHWVVRYWERQVGGQDFDWDALEAISPINGAEDFAAPVLLIHGKKDTVVPIEQSTAMLDALRRAKKDVTLIELESEDHGLSYQASRLDTLRAVAAFVEKHLQAPALTH
ncbi:MAG: prolyl oligopeptidase family serine peptidase, partial [Gammaproteobacteria bacterium]|nr:prolyl oligopeptidase family serine peptidase [Gammaproteobacteria bacterium]